MSTGGFTVRVEQRGEWRWGGLAALVAAADRIGPTVRDEMKRRAPVGDPMNDPHPGRLRNSIRYSRSTKSGAVTIRVTAHTPYASYVVGGTSAHIITARAARSLHWFTPTGSRFARSVNHPGTRADRFPEEAMRATRSRIVDILSDEVGQ